MDRKKQCKLANHNWYKNNAEKVKTKVKTWQKNNKYKYKLGRLKIGAKRRNYNWAIPNDIGYTLISSPCAYCGQIQENFNGLDRVNNSKGYTVNNVVSCCTRCNQAKNTMTIKEFKKHINEIYNYLRD